MLKFIGILEKLLGTEIIQSHEPIRRKNTFNLDQEGNVISLFLDNVHLENLDALFPISDKLIQLSIQRSDLKTLNGISRFINLESLDVSFNPIATKSLDGLADLKKLKELKLAGTNITDTSSLGKINYLESLDLSGSDVLKEVNGLEGLKNLMHLEVNLTQIDDLGKIHVNNTIRSMSLKAMNIERITGLDRFIHLEELKLDGNSITKIEGLDQLKSLKRLNLSSLDLIKIEGLESLLQLEILDLSENNISKIEGLQALHHLKQLNLSQNTIQKIENLDGLTQFEYLLFDSNEIIEFDTRFLSNLSNPCFISLCYNPIDHFNETLPDSIQIQFKTDKPYRKVLF